MFVSIAVIVFSLVLFLYWFRYTCVLILNTKTARDYTTAVAQANQLEFPAVQVMLAEVQAAHGMESARVSLERDYHLLISLLQHASSFQLGSMTLEQRMLMVDYQVMRLWFRVASQFSKTSQARQALVEMADIVSHFANAMGERTASVTVRG
jgi:hypothetical protein